MPDISENTCFAFLKERISTRPEKTLNTFLVGLFPNKLGDLLLHLSRLDLTETLSDVFRMEDIWKLVHLIQHFETTITKTNAYEQAQICRGGVDTRRSGSGNHGITAMYRESISPENFWMWTGSAADIICSGRGPAAMLREKSAGSP